MSRQEVRCWAFVPERPKLWRSPLKTVVSSGDPLLSRRSEVVANRPPRPIGDLFRFCWPFSCLQAGFPGFALVWGVLTVPRGVLV